jgi:hypothetical protein
MSNEVISFLRQQAFEQGFTVFNDVFGRIELQDKKPIKQSSGSVYGIFVQSNTKITDINGTDINELPSLKNFYPVYWGKDISPARRIIAHVRNYKSTGSADLSSNKEIQDKPIIFGAIFVTKYDEFEKHLHEKFRPLIGSSRHGRSSSIVEIEN